MRSMRSKANRRSLRTIIQFMIGGGFTVLINSLADGLSNRGTAFLLAAGTVAVTWVQNYAEDHELIPVILPAPPPEAKQA